MAVDITALYCCLDDFCKVFADWEAHRLLPSEQTRQRSGKLSRAEMLFIVVLFHLSPYKNFKVFYLYGIGGQYRACFDELPHYDRFVSLMPRLFVPLMVLLHGLSGEQTGVYFVDSTKLAVCHNRRIHRHKVFDGLAARGKTSMGWFYGLKLHFVINHKGQIVAVKITPGNTADSTVLDEMTRHLAGKLYADKGYIGRELFHKLWRRGLHLITSIRRNMRNYLMPLADKVMLRKRFVIETVLDTLKSEMGVRRAKAALSSGCKPHPANSLPPEAIGAVMEVTKWLKPSISVSRIGDSASGQAATRVNAEQASKRMMCRPTRHPYRGRLIRLGGNERSVSPAAAPGQGRRHVHKESARNTGSPVAWAGMSNRRPVRDRLGAAGWRRGS